MENQRMAQQQIERERRQVRDAPREQNGYRYVNLLAVEENRQEREEGIRLHHVRAEIEAQLAEEEREAAYRGIDEVQSAARQAAVEVGLHHARGTRFLESGEDVLEFDMAGSGYSEFPQVHKGYGGKVGLDAQGSTCCRGSLLDDAQERQRFEAQYGTRMGGTLARKTHIRSKERGDAAAGPVKRRVTMAGPLAVSGASNSGEYSIENLRQYMLTAAQGYLEPVFQRFEADEASRHPVHIIIRGHSRGAVAAGEGAKLIKHWIQQNYRDYENFVRFELIQYDPVPGFGSRSGVHDVIDLAADDAGSEMAALGENAETTVVYSLHTQHTFWFTPQTVSGVKRIILTPFDHNVGLKQVDATQNMPRAGAAQDGAQENAQGAVRHRGAFMGAGDGEVYRSSGLNELEEGVYIADENNVLVKMPDAASAVRIMDSLWGQVSGQGDRHTRLKEVVRAWFRAHP